MNGESAYPTEKQRSLISAIEGAERFEVDGGGYVHFTGKPMFTKYLDFCNKNGVDKASYLAVKMYLDKYKILFLEYQSTCNHNARTMDRVARMEENEAYVDMGMEPPNDFFMDSLCPEG